MIILEHNLKSKFSPSADRIRNPWSYFKKMTQEELNKLEPKAIDWIKVVETLNGTFDKSAKIMVKDNNYLEQSDNILRAMDGPILKEYIKLSIMKQLCFMFGGQCRANHEKLVSKFFPHEVRNYQKSYCFKALIEHLQELVLYVTLPIGNNMLISDGMSDVKPNGLRANIDLFVTSTSIMISLLGYEFEQLISKMSWMDSQSQEFAKKSMKHYKEYYFNDYISPSWTKEFTKFYEYYKDLPYIKKESVIIYDYYTKLIKYNKEKKLKNAQQKPNNIWIMANSIIVTYT